MLFRAAGPACVNGCVRVDPQNGQAIRGEGAPGSLSVRSDPSVPLSSATRHSPAISRIITRVDDPVPATGGKMSVMNAPAPEAVRRAPKVLLHDHLDGGLRPATIVELADEHGYQGLPTRDPGELDTWMRRGANRRDLVLYLETFAHTVGVMQTIGALVRVARECVEDLADDGVIYAEVRFAPELHLEGGLSLDQVVEAVQEGFRQGMEGRTILVRTLLTAMRTAARSLEIAELSVRWRNRGVCGFDIAGAEAGHPPTRHLDAFEYVRGENFHLTIHAGEAFGLPSIWEAVQLCGSERLGHGVRIVDDISVDDATGSATIGRLGSLIRDRRVPLELCPTSNVHSGAAPSLDKHPIGLLSDLRFRVTVNTDNRLMSNTSMSQELTQLVDAFGWEWDDVERVTINAMKSAFLPYDDRVSLIRNAIQPGYAALKAL
jgi:adenosine deaminase